MNKLSDKAGKLPGELVTIGANTQLSTKFFITQISKNFVAVSSPLNLTNSDFKLQRLANKDEFEEKENPKDHLPIEGVLWFNVQSLMAKKSLGLLFNKFNLHPLLQEDVYNLKSIAKLDSENGTTLLILKRFGVDAFKNIFAEQVAFIYDGEKIATIQPNYNDSFLATKKNLESVKENTDSQFLFYLLLDNLVDNNYVIIENLLEELKSYQRTLLTSETALSNEDVIRFGNSITLVRTQLLKTKELINDLFYSSNIAWDKKLEIYFNDLNNHLDQLLEMIETSRQLFIDLKALQIHAENLHSTDIMRTCAFICIIFLPLILITNLYGMNFSYMPELQSKLGYPICILILAIISLATYYTFKKKYFQ